MGLTKYKLGELIERSTVNNKDLKYGTDLIAGVNNDGVFTCPKGNPLDVDLKPYKLVNNGAFVYNPTRIDLGSLAYRTEGFCIVSHLYIIFYLNEKGKELVDPYYLYMYFHRDEFRREVRFRNFGSQRPEFSFSDMADISITLPSIEQQRKFVDVYLALQNNLAAYQSKVEELKLVCDGYMDQLKKKCGKVKVGGFIEQYDERNTKGEHGVDAVMGISTEKTFIDTKADMNGVSLNSYKVVMKDTFVYVPDTSRRGDKMAIALNRSEKPLLVSSIYTTFRSKDTQKLLPEYLFMFFDRPEFDRYARFNSWGSAREVFTMDDMNDVRIPIPDISVQKEIVNIHKCYIERQRIAAKLKEQLNNLCPILIKGSLETSN
jgi:type I restriction enzyme S subunit